MDWSGIVEVILCMLPPYCVFSNCDSPSPVRQKNPACFSNAVLILIGDWNHHRNVDATKNIVKLLIISKSQTNARLKVAIVDQQRLERQYHIMMPFRKIESPRAPSRQIIIFTTFFFSSWLRVRVVLWLCFLSWCWVHLFHVPWIGPRGSISTWESSYDVVSQCWWNLQRGH